MGETYRPKKPSLADAGADQMGAAGAMEKKKKEAEAKKRLPTLGENRAQYEADEALRKSRPRRP